MGSNVVDIVGKYSLLLHVILQASTLFTCYSPYFRIQELVSNFYHMVY